MSTGPVLAPDAPPPPVTPTWGERVGGFRIIPKLETYPRVVDFVQTALGKAVLLACFGSLLSLLEPHWAEILIALTLATFFPQVRRWVVLAGTLFVLSTTPFFNGLGILEFAAAREHVAINHLQLLVLATAPFFVVCVGSSYFVARRRKSLLARRPVVVLLSCYFGLLAACCYLPVHGQARVLLCGWLAVFGAYFWYLAYSLADSVKSAKAGPLQLSAFHPFWASSTVPYAKTLNYWKTIEAKDAKQLAVSQLKGMKLLAWAYVLLVVKNLLQVSVLGYLRIPVFELIVIGQLHGRQFPAATICWASLLTSFGVTILQTCVIGHQVVAIMRMTGFQALRNSRSPLTSKTIAEFWNRYYYYFKELMVDFFFYPTFVRYFKKNLKLRIAAATFMAAGAGNVLFHFVRDSDNALAVGLPRGILGFGCYAFYCLLLSMGIIVSQLRTPKANPNARWLRRSLAPMLTVSAFFLLLHIFDTTAPGQFSVRVHFLQHLFTGS